MCLLCVVCVKVREEKKRKGTVCVVFGNRSVHEMHLYIQILEQRDKEMKQKVSHIFINNRRTLICFNRVFIIKMFLCFLTEMTA